jgi:hypothetical protein
MVTGLGATGTAMEGVSRFESVTQLGALWNAEFGAVLEVPVLVVQSVPSAQVPAGVQSAGPILEVATQFGGNAGAVTASNPSQKIWKKKGVGVGVAVGIVEVAVGVGEGVPVGVGASVPAGPDCAVTSGTVSRTAAENSNSIAFLTPEVAFTDEVNAAT